MTEGLEAVLFDYGHTLIYFDEQPHAALHDAYENVNHLLATALSREVPAAEVLIENISLAVDAAIQRDYAAGRVEEVQIATVYDTALRALGLVVAPEVIERVMEMEQDGWLNSVHVGPDVIATLAHLRTTGLRLGIVSNAAYRPRLMQRQVATLGLARYFDSLTFSSEVGLRKPHPAIYQDALAKLRVAPGRTLFVGDRLKEDVRGPQALGMRAVLLREWRRDNESEGADYVIDRLGQLPAIVDGLPHKSAPSGTYNGVTSPE